MKLEVGMYVRTFDDDNKGNIGLIIKNYDGELEIAYKKYKLKISVSQFIDGNRNYRDGLKVKSSNNIIDLIEVGDYVNGCKVHKIANCITIILDNEENISWVNPNDIKSIVTKEQFKANEYVVE